MFCDLNAALLFEIEAFCERNGIPEWRFGSLFAADHHMVGHLRAGKGIVSTRVSSIWQKAAAWEAANPAGGAAFVQRPWNSRVARAVRKAA